MNEETPMAEASEAPKVKKVEASDLAMIKRAREKLNAVVTKVEAHNQLVAQAEARARELNEALSQARGAVLFVEEGITSKYDIDPVKEELNLDTGEVLPCSSK